MMFRVFEISNYAIYFNISKSISKFKIPKSFILPHFFSNSNNQVRYLFFLPTISFLGYTN